MEFFLKAKHWQIFLILIVGLFINNLTIEGNPILTMSLNIIGYLTYFSWLLFVGQGLLNYLPKKIEINGAFFLINGFIFIATFIAVLIISGGEEIHFTGFAALLVFYIMYAGFYFMSFPAKLLNSVEQKIEVSLGSYLGDFFLIVFLPIGIWFLQPRVNKIVNEGDSIDSDSEPAE